MPLEQTAVTLNLSLLFPRQIDVHRDALLGSLKTKQYAPIRRFSVSAKEQGTLTPSLEAVGPMLTDWPVLRDLARWSRSGRSPTSPLRLRTVHFGKQRIAEQMRPLWLSAKSQRSYTRSGVHSACSAED